MDDRIYNWALTFADGDVEALEILIRTLSDESLLKGFFFTGLLDYNIRGSKITKVFKECCGGDYDKFYKTIIILYQKEHDKEAVARNLERKKSLPMISTRKKADREDLEKAIRPAFNFRELGRLSKKFSEEFSEKLRAEEPGPNGLGE